MNEKVENPSQFSDEENKLVDQILVHCGAKLQNFIDSYIHPKDYAKVILKIMSSRQKLVAIRLVYHIINKVAAHELVTHNEFSKELTKDKSDTLDIEYIDDRRLSDLLKFLRNDNGLDLNMPVLSKIEGKRKIKSHIRQFSQENKKKHTSFQSCESGGTPIADTLSPEFERLLKLISIPDVISRAHKSMKESGLLLKAIKLQFLGELYAVRMQEDEEKIKNYYKATFVDNRFFTAQKAKDDLNKFGVHSYRSYLLSLTDDQLDELAGKTAHYLTENPINHSYLLSILFNPIYE